MITWKTIPNFIKFLGGSVVAIFVTGASMAWKVQAYQNEFKKEIIEEVQVMRSHDMTFINERLHNIDGKVNETNNNVRMIKQVLMNRGAK